MAQVTITWRCGHRIEVARAEIPTIPTCQTCGERVVTRVSGATPTFKGACTGPLVTSA